MRLANERAHLDWQEGRWLLVARRSNAHVRLGFASFAEYTERLFGYSPRRTEEKLRVAEALSRLPQLDNALETHQLCWSAVRELSRVATESTEATWLSAAQGRSLREIEELVSGRTPGDSPSDPPNESARRHIVRLELNAETLATFREAVAKLRREAAGPITDDDAVLLMARHVLGDPVETTAEATVEANAGRSSYQIEISVCERCGSGTQHGKGHALPVTAEIVEMAECDAQCFRSAPSVSAPGAADTAHRAAHAHRATQTIPPAVRRQVMRRHNGRCAVPGCRHAVFVDVHHVTPRADGGTHDPDELIVLCSAHHRAVHRGRLVVEGTAVSGFLFRHADGTGYGRIASPPIADATSKVFVALTRMGCKEGEARHALADAKITTDAKGNTATFETLLRNALMRLGQRALRVSDPARPTWVVGRFRSPSTRNPTASSNHRAKFHAQRQSRSPTARSATSNSITSRKTDGDGLAFVTRVEQRDASPSWGEPLRPTNLPASPTDAVKP